VSSHQGRGEAAVERGRLRDDADFRRYWIARMASLFGSLVTAVAMPVLVYRLSGSTTLTALTTTLEALPYLLFGLFSGAVGDRFDREAPRLQHIAKQFPIEIVVLDNEDSLRHCDPRCFRPHGSVLRPLSA